MTVHVRLYVNPDETRIPVQWFHPSLRNVEADSNEVVEDERLPLGRPLATITDTEGEGAWFEQHATGED